MKPEKLLYGIRIGNDDYEEELLGVDSLDASDERFEKIKKLAAKDGFDPERFRVVAFYGAQPDFVSVIRKINDRSQNSSTYHKKDGANVRAKLKTEAAAEVKDETENKYQFREFHLNQEEK